VACRGRNDRDPRPDDLEADVIAFSRPFWPLFLHVLGAMVLVGAVLAAVIVSWVGWRRPALPVLARTAFWSLAAVGIPAYVVFRVAAQIIYNDEKDIFGGKDPTWIGIGYGASEPGLLVLLASIGFAYWWKRSGKPVAARTVAVLSSVYLVLLAIAWLAMSGKWG
jgi:cytochrome bd-type quinol oxidase subunit 1